MRWKVIGPRPYRGYSPGETIIGDLEPASAQRAVDMKVLELLDSEPLRLDPNAVTPPAPAVEVGVIEVELNPEQDPDEHESEAS